MTSTPSKSRDAQSIDLQSIPEAPSLDVLIGLLANHRRRYTLQSLLDFQTPMALADLAREVASSELGIPISDVPDEEVERIYISLYHTHIPKLAEANIVEYTEGRDVVTLSLESEHVESLVEFATPSK